MNNEYLVEKIRTQYTEREHSELTALKKLDKTVKAPANAFAYGFGTFSALLLGSGMSLIMTDISQTLGLATPMADGLALGIVGLLMALVNYPVYKIILRARRKKYAAEIITLSDRIMQEAQNA